MEVGILLEQHEGADKLLGPADLVVVLGNRAPSAGEGSHPDMLAAGVWQGWELEE